MKTTEQPLETERQHHMRKHEDWVLGGYTSEWSQPLRHPPADMTLATYKQQDAEEW